MPSDHSSRSPDRIEPLLVGFGPGGEPLGEHGFFGGGPEEFVRPVGLVTGGIEGEAWALDTGRRAFIRVSRPGDPWAPISLSPDSFRPSPSSVRDVSLVRVRTARLGEEVILPRSVPPQESGMASFWLGVWGADLVAIDPADGTARSVLRLMDVLGDPTPHWPPTPDFLPFPPWFRLWTVCSNREIRVHDRIRNEIRGFTPNGLELEAIALPEPTLTSVSEEQFATAMLEVAAMEAAGSVGRAPLRVDTARLLPFLRGRIEGDPTQLARLLPRYVDLHCTEDGALWARPFDIDVGGLRGGPTWLRIAGDGRLQEVRLPPRFDPLRFTTDRIWGVQRDELDVPSVAWIAW